MWCSKHFFLHQVVDSVPDRSIQCWAGAELAPRVQSQCGRLRGYSTRPLGPDYNARGAKGDGAIPPLRIQSWCSGEIGGGGWHWTPGTQSQCVRGGSARPLDLNPSTQAGRG